MRVLGIGDYNDLGSVYMHLVREGHEVRVHVIEQGSRDVLDGLVQHVDAWEHHLPWIKEAGDEGLILFEEIGRGELQDRLRKQGYNVLGGSAYGDKLEQQRGYAQALLGNLGYRRSRRTTSTTGTTAAR